MLSTFSATWRISQHSSSHFREKTRRKKSYLNWTHLVPMETQGMIVNASQTLCPIFRNSGFSWVHSLYLSNGCNISLISLLQRNHSSLNDSLTSDNRCSVDRWLPLRFRFEKRISTNDTIMMRMMTYYENECCN